MERYYIKKIKGAKLFDNQYQVIDRQTKTVVSEQFHKSFAVDKVVELKLSDPNHPKHWLYLATTTGHGVPSNILFK